MMKKVAAVLLTAVLVMGSVFTCFAATSPSASDTSDYTVTDASGSEIVVNPTDEEILSFNLSTYVMITTGSSLTLMDVSSALESVEGYDESTASVVETYEVELVGVDGAVTVTTPVAGVTEDNLVAVLFKAADSDEWVVVDASLITVNDDGTVSIDGVEVSGEFAFVLEDTASSGDGSGSDATPTDGSGSSGSSTNAGSSGNVSGNTGDISLALPIALLVIAAVAIVVLVARGKKEEN